MWDHVPQVQLCSSVVLGFGLLRQDSPAFAAGWLTMPSGWIPDVWISLLPAKSRARGHRAWSFKFTVC
jgi:hypothetical protein